MNGARGTNFIHDESAYEEGKRRAIMRNAAKGRSQRWHAEDSTRRELVTWLETNCGDHVTGGFLFNMLAAIQEYGSLTPAQEAATRKVMADRIAKAETRKAERAAIASKSVHIGAVGERREFDLTLNFVASFESQFGMLHIHGFTDSDGNIVIYKGSVLQGSKGERFTIKATIKEHGERDGAKQTVISRLKILSFTPAPEPAPAVQS